MRGTDYVVKRLFFAVATVFVAITLNFVLFRAISGDAVSALRCRQCTQQFKEYQRKQLGLDKSKWEQYWNYLGDLAQGNLGRSLRTEEPVTRALWDPIKNTMAMVALGTVISIALGIVTGVAAAWWRGTWFDKGALWGSLGFYSMPPQWLGLLVVLYLTSVTAAFEGKQVARRRPGRRRYEDEDEDDRPRRRRRDEDD